MKTRVIRLTLLASLFALVLGGRWMVIERFGSDLPQWDQWDAEGLHLLVPWKEHRLDLAELFHPHNEHRVVLTKLLNLGLTLANGQWDQRLESVVNAALAALFAIGLFAFGRERVGPRWRAPLFLVIAAGFGLPLAWQNVLAGFHSQQFFLLGLSFGAIAWLPRRRPWSAAWWLGAACAVLALGSMATGFVAAAVAGGLALEAVRRREISRAAAEPTLILCGLLAVVGGLTRVTVAYHDPLKAHGLVDFALTVARSLEWPATANIALSVIFWAPWCWLVGAALGKRAGADRAGGAVLAGLGAWVVLHVLAAAYARGAGGPYPASRYIDVLVLGAVVNATALGWLWRNQNAAPPLTVAVHDQNAAAPIGARNRSRASRGAATSRAAFPRQLLAGLAVAWLAAFGIGVWVQLDGILAGDLPSVRSYERRCEQNVRDYLATGDESYLWRNDVPYPGVGSFLERLGNPALRALMPASVRPPLPLALGGAQTSFVELDPRAQAHASDEFAPEAAGVPTGLSPRTPFLSNRVMRGSFGAAGAAATGDWSSVPLRAEQGGWLKFDVAGQLGEPGVSLELRDARTHEPLSAVLPNKVPGDAWRSAYVRAPDGPFVVTARDEDPHRWMAFAEPVEMGPLSYRAWLAARQGWLIAVIGGIVAGLLGALAALRLRSRS